MSTLTSFLKLIKPTRLERYTVNILNSNSDAIDAGVKELDLSTFNIVTAGLGDGFTKSPPAGQKLTMFVGRISTGSGNGGEVRTGTPATNGDGIGGLWFGYQGIPKFKNAFYINISEGGNTQALQGIYEVMDVNATRIKFRGRRMQPASFSDWTNGYGGLTLDVMIIGWV